MAWFKVLTGFEESAFESVAAQFVVDGELMTSVHNGRAMRHGSFSLPTVAELRGHRPMGYGPLTVREVVGDARDVHLDPASAGAIFQVASQFNTLEMVSPSVTPEHGIDRYEHDHTQGPACAIACGAGTLYRNYLVPIGHDIGQSASRQINCLADLSAHLGIEIAVQNGYALPSTDQLQQLYDRLADLDEPARDALMGHLRVGVHANTEVTLNRAGHTVTQVFCSAVPITYSRHSASQWEPFARLILDAAYEAVFHVAVATSPTAGTAASPERTKLFLTMLGGGAFGNPTPWIIDAIERSLCLFRSAPIEVMIVSYRGRQLEAERVVSPGPSWTDSLFEPGPDRWGLRGDPHLWAELRSSLRWLDRPRTSRDLSSLVERELRRLAGRDFFHRTAPVFIERYERGGMSGGVVAPEVWQRELVPLLLSRFQFVES